MILLERREKCFLESLAHVALSQSLPVLQLLPSSKDKKTNYKGLDRQYIDAEEEQKDNVL